jgi:2-amino-4-hydroxy-6-hydroxymethyldihydropteridine diphosphokinase
MQVGLQVARSDMVLAYIGLGGNLDSGAIQPAQTLLQAASDLDQLPHTRLMQLSPLYRSAPIGYDDQPDFINAVALLQTRLSAIALLQQDVGLTAQLRLVRYRLMTLCAHIRASEHRQYPRQCQCALTVNGQNACMRMG